MHLRSHHGLLPHSCSCQLLRMRSVNAREVSIAKACGMSTPGLLRGCYTCATCKLEQWVCALPLSSAALAAMLCDAVCRAHSWRPVRRPAPGRACSCAADHARRAPSLSHPRGAVGHSSLSAAVPALAFQGSGVPRISSGRQAASPPDDGAGGGGRSDHSCRSAGGHRLWWLRLR